MMWGSDVLYTDKTGKSATQARKLQYVALKKVLGGAHGSSGQQLAWIGGWDTIREIQDKRLGMLSWAVRGRGTLEALWKDEVIGAR